MFQWVSVVVLEHREFSFDAFWPRGVKNETKISRPTHCAQKWGHVTSFTEPVRTQNVSEKSRNSLPKNIPASGTALRCQLVHPPPPVHPGSSCWNFFFQKSIFGIGGILVDPQRLNGFASRDRLADMIGSLGDGR